MKRFGSLKVIVVLLSYLLISCSTPEKKTNFYTSDLFEDVQLKAVFPDSKTFVDCTPKRDIEEILDDYQSMKDKPDFDLKEFVNLNFNLPQSPVVHVTPGLPLRDHLEELWRTLARGR